MSGLNFFLNEVPTEEWEIHQNYIYEIRHKWKKEVFLETAYMVLRKGDIIKLISGINNSGKTWTSISEARYANWLLRNYWGKPEKYGFHLPLEILNELMKVRKFSMRYDVIYYPDPSSIRERIADGSRFNTIAVTEGMKAAYKSQKLRSRSYRLNPRNIHRKSIK